MAVAVGAIRWDAWYTVLGPAASTRKTLSDPLYQYRAPFWSYLENSRSIGFTPSTTTMSQEIAYAKAAKLDYWAFLLYNEPANARQMMAAYDLFQVNPDRNNINWCQIRSTDQWGSTGNYASQVATALAMCQQSNYQKVQTNRPLVYVNYSSADLTNYWGGSNANLKAALDAFRAACTGAGLGNPYIVCMAGAVATQSVVSPAIGADGVSNYTTNLPVTFPGTFANITTAVTTYVTQLAASGLKVIPICHMGWDRRPRIQRPVPWEVSSQRPYMGMRKYFTEGTPSELAAQVLGQKNYVIANPSICDAQAVLIYAWNEFDEGGWLCPTLGDMTGARCAALGAVL
jgi:hypothetical protein